MARVPYLDADDLAPGDRDLLARPANLFRALVHSPEGFRRFAALGDWIRHGSTLDPRLRELAILQVGWVARAAYEWTHHIQIGGSFGVTSADVDGLMADSEGRESSLGPLERLVLRATRQMTTEGAISDEDFAALAEALGDEHVVELVLIVGFYNAVVRILGSLAIDMEPEYDGVLARFPLR